MVGPIARTGTTVHFGLQSGRIDFAGIPGRRIAFDVTNSDVQAATISCSPGRFVMPQGSGRVPVVVCCMGAEHDSALTDYFLQRMLPRRVSLCSWYDNARHPGIGGRLQPGLPAVGRRSRSRRCAKRGACGGPFEPRRLSGRQSGGWWPRSRPVVRQNDFVIVCFGWPSVSSIEDRQKLKLKCAKRPPNREIGDIEAIGSSHPVGRRRRLRALTGSLSVARFRGGLSRAFQFQLLDGLRR